MFWTVQRSSKTTPVESCELATHNEDEKPIKLPPIPQAEIYDEEDNLAFHLIAFKSRQTLQNVWQQCRTPK